MSSLYHTVEWKRNRLKWSTHVAVIARYTVVIRLYEEIPLEQSQTAMNFRCSELPPPVFVPPPPLDSAAQYRSPIRPCIDSHSHLGGGGRVHSHSLIRQGGIKAFDLINFPPLTDGLQPLSHCCIQEFLVASLAIFYPYFHLDFSYDLAYCMPLLLQPRHTRLS